MDLLAGGLQQVQFFADASAVSTAMRSYITPLLGSLIAIASIGVVFFLVHGGYLYMTSSGQPERLQQAKKVIRNALIGLVIIIAAATMTAILTQAYNSGGGNNVNNIPALNNIEPQSTSGGLVDVLINAITGLLKNIIQSAAKPFLAALNYFTAGTPLMAENSGVFNLWLAMVAMADVLFIVVVAMLGFHVMSWATFGLEEIEFKHLLPQIGLIFLLINSSIFAIDALIGLSNGMITALNAGFPSQSVWDVLTGVVDKQDGLGLAALLIMVVFLILSVMLLVYYVLRLVVLYIGAVLAPIVFLLWLLPSFKDFATSAMKTYITTIFVLFVHVVILQLAASIFLGMRGNDPAQALNPIMSMVVGTAIILALLKTQGVMSQLAYVSGGARNARMLGGQFVNAVSHISRPASRAFHKTVNSGSSRRAAANDAGSSISRKSAKSAPGYASTNRSTAPKTSQSSGRSKPRQKETPAPTTPPSPRTRVAPKMNKETKP